MLGQIAAAAFSGRMHCEGKTEEIEKRFIIGRTSFSRRTNQHSLRALLTFARHAHESVYIALISIHQVYFKSEA
ncbi:hypothetical protein BLX87_23675 [Bacillus sp. VT-16-64]|jgi:hypothetical protein|nr:hypothetical protein BLX87_23675 [Bacillus sp. VT-16-64]